MKLEAQLDTVAAKHGFSPAAVRQFYDAIRAGNGTAAQFSHPEFGGMGQWMRSGMNDDWRYVQSKFKGEGRCALQ